MNQIKRFEFRFGSTYLTLEVPPFYVNFQKRNFSSIMEWKNPPKEGVVVYIYVTRYRHVDTLLLLKRLHPDFDLPDELKDSGAAIEEPSPKEFEEFAKAIKIEGLVTAIKGLEEEREYGGNGIWIKRIDLFRLYMLLIIKESKWTVRPAISKENISGYGFEIPIDTGMVEPFMEELREGEFEEIHNHVENQHFHLTLDSLERCVGLAKEWDYYFSTRTRWRQTVFLS